MPEVTVSESMLTMYRRNGRALTGAAPGSWAIRTEPLTRSSTGYRKSRMLLGFLRRKRGKDDEFRTQQNNPDVARQSVS